MYVTAIIPILVFLGIVMAIWAVLSMISSRNSRALDRLQRLSRPQSLVDIEDPAAKAKAEKFAGIIETAKALGGSLMPQTDLERDALKTRLANAGFRSDAACMVYSGIRVACLILFFVMSA